MSRKGQKKTVGKFDPEFRFLLDLDPALEGWRAWAADYWAELPRTSTAMRAGLAAFMVTYLHGQGLHTLSAEQFFAGDRALPTPDAALGLALINTEKEAQKKHDTVSDFLDWILRQKLSVLDADGHPSCGAAPPRQPLPEKGCQGAR